MGKLTLSRRTVLRGLLGGAAVAVALPPLEAMLNPHGEKLASGAPLPRRFATWFFGNGVYLDKWVPQTQGPAWELTPELAPLAAVRDYCSILTGFDNKAGYGRRGHHDGVAGCFSGYPFIELPPSGVYSSKFGGPSIDQVAAKAIGAQTYLPSLELGVSRRVSTDQGPTLQFLSHKGPDQPAPPLYDPQKVFAKLFAVSTPAQDPTAKLRVSVLDAVHEDAKRLKARVGKLDQDRLDAHLTSIEQLEKQIQAVAPACAAPPMPGVQNVDDVNGHEPLQEVSQIMADLLTVAFACDLTRVASFMQAGGFGSTLYWMTGATVEEHSLTHMPGQEGLVHDAIVFNMECFAYLLSRLQSTPEGSGNLLDNCCIFLGSDCSEGWSHGCFDQPIVVAGRGGGALQYPGVHYRSPNKENTSDVLLTCLQTVAPSASEVGGDEGYSNTPCKAFQV